MTRNALDNPKCSNVLHGFLTKPESPSFNLIETMASLINFMLPEVTLPELQFCDNVSYLVTLYQTIKLHCFR